MNMTEGTSSMKDKTLRKSPRNVLPKEDERQNRFRKPEECLS